MVTVPRGGGGETAFEKGWEASCGEGRTSDGVAKFPHSVNDRREVSHRGGRIDMEREEERSGGPSVHRRREREFPAHV